MTDRKKFTIVYVDDREDSKAQLKRAFGARLQFIPFDQFITPPSGSERRNLQKLICSADIVLVDLELRPDADPDWTVPANDGIDLLESVKGYFRSERVTEKCATKPRFFVIFSGKLDKLDDRASALPQYVATRYDVDWIFDKSADQGAGTSVIRCLKSMIAALSMVSGPTPKSNAQISKLLTSLLAAPDAEGHAWIRNAWEEFAECKPPIGGLQEIGGVAELLRWLLHVALPYPSFVLDAPNVAALLGIEPASIASNLIAPDSRLRKLLRPYEYRGAFSDFFGPRWWKAGIAQFWWDRTRGKKKSSNEAIQELRRLSGEDLQATTASQPVLIYDADVLNAERLAELSESVQIRPAFWPTSLTEPWVAIATVVQNPDLLPLVISRDQERVPRPQANTRGI